MNGLGKISVFHNKTLILNRNPQPSPQIFATFFHEVMREKKNAIVLVLRIGFRVSFELLFPKRNFKQNTKACNFGEKSMASLKLKLHVPSRKCHSDTASTPTTTTE